MTNILVKYFKQSLFLAQSLSLWCWGAKLVARTGNVDSYQAREGELN